MSRVLIAADIKLYREGLTEILGRFEEIAVVGNASDRAESLDRVRELGPEVVLLDMGMPQSLATVRSIVESHSAVHVVALAVPERDVIACAEAGISGYVPREGSVPDLVAAIMGAVRGELSCSPRIAGGLFRRISALAAERSSPGEPWRLTPRQREVAQLVERGLSNKEIARTLCIEVSTVKNHVHSILEMLHVHRRAEAAALLRPALDRPSS